MQKKVFGISFLIFLLFIIAGVAFKQSSTVSPTTPSAILENPKNSSIRIIQGTFDESKLKPDSEWAKILTKEQFHILREQGTETPFTGALEHEERKGTFFSVGCNEPVFRSEQKFDSGTGWPSFWDPSSPDALVLKVDSSIPFEQRVEVLDKCGGHLGHVFDDGPQPTGKRYCMNSAALYFVPDEK